MNEKNDDQPNQPRKRIVLFVLFFLLPLYSIQHLTYSTHLFQPRSQRPSSSKNSTFKSYIRMFFPSE